MSTARRLIARSEAAAAQDYEATCIAYADEGVEHPWTITAGPADSGLEIELANEG